MPRVADPNEIERKLGRPPSADIWDQLNMANDNPGIWIAEDYSNAHATSARRQFKRYPELEVMTSKSRIPGHRTVLVRYTPQQED